jgi:hypothetical protein
VELRDDDVKHAVVNGGLDVAGIDLLDVEADGVLDAVMVVHVVARALALADDTKHAVVEPDLEVLRRDAHGKRTF